MLHVQRTLDVRLQEVSITVLHLLLILVQLLKFLEDSHCCSITRFEICLYSLLLLTGKHSVSLTYDLSANTLEAFATGFAESYNEPIRKRQLTSTPSEAQSKVMLHTQLDS